LIERQFKDILGKKKVSKILSVAVFTAWATLGFDRREIPDALSCTA
jgi:hypothetical protein